MFPATESAVLKGVSGFELHGVFFFPSDKLLGTILTGGGTIVNRTYGTHKNLYVLPIFTSNIWSYLLWSPSNSGVALRHVVKAVTKTLEVDASAAPQSERRIL